MKVGRKIIVVAIALALFGTLFLSSWLSTEKDQLGENAKPTTLEDIIAGKFPTALDKEGDNGVLVKVDGLRVTGVWNESDGDWHLDVTGGRILAFITEVTPYWQAHGVAKPAAGSVIDEIGFPYCDRIHGNKAWHGNTRWEIHPVINWALHTASAQGPVSFQTSDPKLQNSRALPYLQGAKTSVKTPGSIPGGPAKISSAFFLVRKFSLT